MNKKVFSALLFSVILLTQFLFIQQSIAASDSDTICQDFLDTQVSWEESPDIIYPLEVPIGSKTYVENWYDYLFTVYNFAIGSAGILASVAMMYGGFSWAISAGNESRITKAKDTIKSALIGLIIALCSYIILSFISPNLVNINQKKILKIPLPEFDSSCELQEKADLSKITSADGKASVSISGGGCSSMTSPLTIAANNLSIYNSYYPLFGTRKITGSGARDAETQWHLRMCYCNNVINKKCDDSCYGCEACGDCNPAAKPCSDDGGTSFHLLGLAVDVNFSDATFSRSWKNNSPTLFPSTHDDATWAALSNQAQVEQDQIDLRAIMTGTGQGALAGYQATGLTGISNEFWHFQLKGATKCNSAPLTCPCSTASIEETCDPMGLETVCNWQANTWSCEVDGVGTNSYSRLVDKMTITTETYCLVK